MWCIQNCSCENDQFIPMHCPNKLPDMVVVTLFLVTDGQASPWSLRHYMAIYCLYMASGALEQNTGVYGCLGLVIPLRLVWQLEHLRCKQTAWGTFSWGKNAFSFFCPNEGVGDWESYPFFGTFSTGAFLVKKRIYFFQNANKLNLNCFFFRLHI